MSWYKRERESRLMVTQRVVRTRELCHGMEFWIVVEYSIGHSVVVKGCIKDTGVMIMGYS